MLLDGMGYIRNPIVFSRVFNAFIKSFFCYPEQSFHIRRYLAHRKSGGSISVKSIFISAQVYPEYITLLQNPVRGYAMNYLIID